MAEEYVALGEWIVERQKAIVIELERGDHGAARAKHLLAAYKTTLRLQIEHRDRLRDDLDQL